MKISHIFLLILVAAIWGFNFVAIKVGLNHVQPLTFTAMRFFFAAFPAIFFVKRPKLPLHKIAAYGLVMFAGQFTFLFTAIHAGFSPGLASLVLQVQAFFTIGFAVLFLSEKPLLVQLLGALVAAGGIAVVALHNGGEVTVTGLSLLILAAISWGAGNVLTKTFGKIGKKEMFGIIIWGSLFAFPPLVALAFIMEGPDTIRQSVTGMAPATLWSLAYIVCLSTYVGYSIWSRMLTNYSAVVVAPFTLLVPAFGMLGAAIFLGEAYPLWKFLATLLIISGLCLNQFGAKLQKFLRQKLKVKLAL